MLPKGTATEVAASNTLLLFLQVFFISGLKLDSDAFESLRNGFFENEAYELISSRVSAGFSDLITAWKCLLHTDEADKSSLKAAIPASLHSPASSAPVKSSVSSAIFLRSISSSTFIFRV